MDGRTDVNGGVGALLHSPFGTFSLICMHCISSSVFIQPVDLLERSCVYCVLIRDNAVLPTIEVFGPTPTTRP